MYIFTTKNFFKAIQSFNLTSAKLITPELNEYCIYELSEDDFNTLDNAEWNNEWGWWRWTTGSLEMGRYSYIPITINDNSMLLYYHSNYSQKQYNSILEYIFDMWPVFSNNITKICSIIVECAKLNQMDLSEFIKKVNI